MLTAADRRLLGREIRRRRQAVGMSQRQLGAPLTRAYVSAVELGRICPSLPSLVLFARRLGVPVTELVTPLDGAPERTTRAP